MTIEQVSRHKTRSRTHMPDTGQTSRKLCPVFRLPASQGNKRQRGQRQLDVLQEVQLGHAELHNKYKIIFIFIIIRLLLFSLGLAPTLAMLQKIQLLI